MTIKAAYSKNPERIKADLWTAQHISAKTASVEASLIATKWFDYRFLSPLECTRLFAKAYTEIYQSKCSTPDGPLRSGTVVKGWENNQREVTSFWRARQFADRYCMPYEFFLSKGIEFALVDIGYKRIPRPNQLYSGKHGRAMTDFASAVWLECNIHGQIEYSTLPQYQLANFNGLPAQYSHQDWLVEKLRDRHSMPADIAAVCLNSNLLPIERVLVEFGPNCLEEAERHKASFPVKPLLLTDDGFQPGCFGVAHAYSETRSECSACRFAKGCETWGNAIRRRLKAARGTDDAINTRKKELQRRRKAKSREKARLSVKMGAGARVLTI